MEHQIQRYGVSLSDGVSAWARLMSGTSRSTLSEYLLLFGVELEALIQRAAVLLAMLLLLIPHALCILHHLLLDVAKQAAAQDGRKRLHTEYKSVKTNIWWHV